MGVTPEALLKKVATWAAKAPLYRDRPTPATLDAFAQWPFVTKADIRDGFPENFLGPGERLDQLVESGQVELEHTSGSSGERTPLLLPKGWWGAQERSTLLLNPTASAVLGNDPDPRRIAIVSPMCSNDISYVGVPSREERVVGNTLFLSLSRLPFLWSQADLARMAGEALEWDPVILDVDPVYGVVFARYCEQKGVRLPSLRFIICSYEFVSGVHRAMLERVFGAPVINLYGSTETGHLLVESASGEFVPGEETAWLEVANADRRGIGDLIVTTLTNDFMPLLRYAIGDLVEKLPNAGGERYRVHGRAEDAFRVPGNDGCRVTVLDIDTLVSRTPGIVHYELTEIASSQFLMKFIPSTDAASDSRLKALRDEMKEMLYAQDVIFQETSILMPGPSGKFRLCTPEGVSQ